MIDKGDEDSNCVFALDTNIFILLTKEGYIKEILENGKGKLLIMLPPSVNKELEHRPDSQRRIFMINGKNNCIIKDINPRHDTIASISEKYRLGEGEIACIAYCKDNPAVMFVSNDKIAINKATEEKIKTLSYDQFLKLLEDKGIIYIKQ